MLIVASRSSESYLLAIGVIAVVAMMFDFVQCLFPVEPKDAFKVAN